MKPLLIFITAATIAGCSKETPPPVVPFALSDTMMTRIALDTAKNSDVQGELKLTGKIVANEDKVVDIFPLVGGSVEDVFVELGDHVEKGATLAVIRSGEIADYEQQLRAAESNLSVARKNYEAEEDMYKGKLVSERDFVSAQNEMEKAEGEVRKIQEIFKIYTIGKESSYIVKAPMAGFVVSRNVNRGMQLRPDHAERLFKISELNDVWTIASVYESDIAKVKVGYKAEVTTLSYPEKVFTGKIDRIYNVLDPVTKVMNVRVKLNNPGYVLKPEMFANVTVHYSEGKKMVAIPSGSVIFDKNKNFVMVYRSKNDVESREISVYKNVDGTAYLNSGVRAGEMIVSRYHLLLYDALND